MLRPQARLPSRRPRNEDPTPGRQGVSAMQPLSTLVDRVRVARRRTRSQRRSCSRCSRRLAFGQEAEAEAPAPPGLPAGTSTGRSTSTPRGARSASPTRSTRTRSPSNPRAISATTGSKGSIKPAVEPGVHDRQLCAVLRNVQRRRRAHVRRCADARRRRCLLVRSRRSRRSAGAPATSSLISARTRSTSRSAARDTGSATACCSGTARRKAARAAAIGRNARQAFEFAAIGRFKPGNHTFEAFYLDKDDLPEADSSSKLSGSQLRVRDRRGHDARRHVHGAGRRTRPRGRNATASTSTTCARLPRRSRA